MIGLGTIINTIAIILGGIAGKLFGNLLKEDHRDSLTMVCGISTIFIAIAGAMEGMLGLEDGVIVSGQAMMVTISLALGTLIGELINIEDFFIRFGEWLKIKTKNAKDVNFVNAFVTASLTVCIGAMAVVGSIEDGISGDYSILATKAVLDLIIIMVMTCSMGKGCVFSAIPVLIIEGLITLLASFIKPFVTTLAMSYLSLVGSILIFCVGINLVWGKKIKVANMLPALVVAVAISFI